MENAYAQALWKMIEGGTKPKEAVAALHEMLVRLGRAALMPKIGHAFARIAERDRGRNGVVLSVAREKDERNAHKEMKEFLAQMDVDAKDVATQIDESLIGGWRLEGKEQLVDASFKKQLLSLYNRATQL